MAAEVPELDIFVDIKNFEEGLRDVLKHIKPEWKRDDIKFKGLQNGHVNLMQTAYVDETNKADWVVARVFDTKVDIMEKYGMAKEFEFKAAKLFSEIDAGPSVLGIFKNGIIIRFVQGLSISWSDLSAYRTNQKLFLAVARGLAKVHCKSTHKIAVEKYGFDKAPPLDEIMTKMAAYDWGDAVLVDEGMTKWFNSKVLPLQERIAEFMMITDIFKTANIPKTFCHMDSNPTNLIYLEEEDKVVFCDFESSTIGQPGIDITSFLEGAGVGLAGSPFTDRFSEETARRWIRTYLAEKNMLNGGSEDVDEAELDKYHEVYDMIQIAMGFVVHIIMVSLVQSGAPKSYLETGIVRLDYYWKNKERMLTLRAKHCKSD